MIALEDIKAMSNEEEQLEMFEYWGEKPAVDFADWDQYRIDTMMLNEYQQRIERFILTSGTNRLYENTLGLVGEAGEVAEKIKKSIRDGAMDQEAVAKELGDVLFYCAALATVLGQDLGTIANNNIEKLLDRKARGMLKGNGDNR